MKRASSLQERISRPPEEENPARLIVKELFALLTQLWQALASLHRIYRRDKPKGLLPSAITARPKGRGLTPRHEWLID